MSPSSTSGTMLSPEDAERNVAAAADGFTEDGSAGPRGDELFGRDHGHAVQPIALRAARGAARSGRRRPGVAGALPDLDDVDLESERDCLAVVPGWLSASEPVLDGVGSDAGARGELTLRFTARLEQ